MQNKLHPYPASREVLEKIESKHGIQWTEVQELFEGQIKIFRTHRKDQYGESRYVALGRSHAGRYITVFFVAVAPGQAKVITARDMDDKEKNRFRSK